MLPLKINFIFSPARNFFQCNYLKKTPNMLQYRGKAICLVVKSDCFLVLAFKDDGDDVNEG